MGLANVVSPPLQVEKKTTTIGNSVKFARYGQIVEVELYNFSVTSSTSTDVLELPPPANGYAVFRLQTSSATVGKLEYASNNKWVISGTASGIIYGTYSYIAAEGT